MKLNNLMLIYVLALIDIHTLFVLLFHSNLNYGYIFTGFSIAFVKGLIFFSIGRDLFSLIDIIISLLMLLLLFNIMPLIIKIIIALYLSYKIIMSLI